MKAFSKWDKEGTHARKQGKVASRNQESQGKDEGCGSTRKTIGFWTSVIRELETRQI
jgi:hypothetical protein